MSNVDEKIKFAKRQKAQNLDLSSMNIGTLPEEIYQLKTLLFLNLSNNSISEIGKSIALLINLKDLNLENNKINILPIEIISLQNMTNLNLKNNPIMEKLADYNYDWKSSIKNYLSNNDLNLNEAEISPTNISLKSSNYHSLNSMSKTNSSSNQPFNFKMSNRVNLKDIQSTTTIKFNMKKKETEVIGEIPGCDLLSGEKNPINSNMSKREALNKIIKGKVAIDNLNENDTDDRKDYIDLSQNHKLINKKNKYKRKKFNRRNYS